MTLKMTAVSTCTFLAIVYRCGGKVVLDARDGGGRASSCMAPPPEVCHHTSCFYALLTGATTPCPGGTAADAYQDLWACACDCTGACPEACGDGGVCQGAGSARISACSACNSSAAPSSRPARSTEGGCIPGSAA